MKKVSVKLITLFYVALATVFNFNGFSQTYTFVNGTTFSVSLDTSTLIYTKGIEVVNTGTYNLNLSWELTYKDTLIDSHFELCNSGICFTNLQPTGSMPTIMPGGKGWLKMHIFTGKTTGRNTVKYVVKDSLGRIDTLTFIADVIKQTGINELKNNSSAVSVYPNPATNFILINGIKPGNTEIEIRNLSGVIVYKSELKEAKNRIETDFLPSGIYLYQITENNFKVKSGKFLISSK